MNADNLLWINDLYDFSGLNGQSLQMMWTNLYQVLLMLINIPLAKNYYDNRFLTEYAATVLWPLPVLAVTSHCQLKTGEFCWSKV